MSTVWNDRSERSGLALERCGDCWASVTVHDKPGGWVWRTVEVQEIRHNTESRTETRKCVGRSWILLTLVRDKFSCWCF